MRVAWVVVPVRLAVVVVMVEWYCLYTGMIKELLFLLLD